MQELVEITKDNSLLKNFNHEGIVSNEKEFALSKEDEMLLSILHPKKDASVD
jgi:hypothetical protein